METGLRFLVKVRGTDVIRLGSWISIHKNITMNDSSRIINLPKPTAGGGNKKLRGLAETNNYDLG